jgi:hypothetical protein
MVKERKVGHLPSFSFLMALLWSLPLAVEVRCPSLRAERGKIRHCAL